MFGKELSIGSVVFNDNDHRAPSHVTHNVNINQNLAPTAAHIKLLQEMRKAVEDDILHSFSVASSNINLVGFVMRAVYPHNEVRIRAAYIIGTKEYLIETTISEIDYIRNGMEGIARMCFRNMAETLTEHFFSVYGNEIVKNVTGSR